MIVTCPQCTARYKLDKKKISARGAKITCPRCRHVFVVYRDEDQDEVTNSPLDTVAPDTAQTTAAADTPRNDASALDFRKVGISSWKVRVKIGLVYDFSDIKTLRKYIQDGRVTSDDVISHDGDTWVTIGDIPDLDAYFIEIYQRCEADQAEDESTGPNEFIDDEDTNVIGMGSLGGKLAEQALALATAEAEAELAATTPTSSPGPGQKQVGPKFVDPFAALKDKQRERINQRRQGGSPSSKAESSGGGSTKVAIAALALVLLGGGLWWWNTQQDSNAASKPTQGFNTQPVQPTKADKSTTIDDADNGVDEMLRELDAERENEPEEVDPLEGAVPVIPDGAVPVGPRDGNTGVRPGGEPPPNNPSVDHEKDCLTAGGSANWTGAVSSCGPAMQSSGNSKVALYYGIGLSKRGQGSQAKGVLEAVAPVECTANLYLGRIYGGEGDIASANGSYQKYKGCNPADAGTADAEMQALNGG